MTLVRWSTTCCNGVCCNAMYGAAAWRGTAGALGSVRCGVDGVGSARQAFGSASAFNQNIGSWNTASVTTMEGVRALVPSHTCSAQPKSLSQQWSGRRCGDGPPRMWASPGAYVGDVQSQMWARLGSTGNESCFLYL
jgi:surface protein